MARWTKDQRERAKAEDKLLVAIAVDGRTATTGRMGLMEFTAPVDLETAREVLRFMQKIIEERGKGG